jgi:pimeloyl-ACP methyl ester carboxylesterase
MREEAITFGQKNSLVGVLTDSATGPANGAKIGAILLNAGVIHHVGPGRIYVKMARQLASLGFTVLRFDFSGIGDSKPRYDNLPFEKSSIDETQRAMDLLAARRGIRRFILIGGCSGARVSFATASCDPRLLSVILINFEVTSDEDRELDTDSNRRKDEHYYLNFAIRNYRSWRKLLTGEAEYRRIFGVVASQLCRRFAKGKAESEPAQWKAFRKDLNAIIQRDVRPIFVCSESDPALTELREAGGRELAELCSQNKMELVVIRRADHTFSSLDDQERLINALRQRASQIARSVALVASASA